MTRSDRWNARPAVERYRAWCDLARLAATGSPSVWIDADVIGVYAFVHLAMPESWSEAKKAAHAGTLHRQRPDASNFLKAVEDALFVEDAQLSISQCVKFWIAEGEECRVDVFLLVTPGTPHTAPFSTR